MSRPNKKPGIALNPEFKRLGQEQVSIWDVHGSLGDRAQDINHEVQHLRDEENGLKLSPSDFSDVEGFVNHRVYEIEMRAEFSSALDFYQRMILNEQCPQDGEYPPQLICAKDTYRDFGRKLQEIVQKIQNNESVLPENEQQKFLKSHNDFLNGLLNFSIDNPVYALFEEVFKESRLGKTLGWEKQYADEFNGIHRVSEGSYTKVHAFSVRKIMENYFPETNTEFLEWASEKLNSVIVKPSSQINLQPV